MHVIGTAGHVDHGKSTLVLGLTGIDPDRLREEKERGLTIDLGFAWLELPSGREVSIVDVPGHERFIKNMLAGAGGVDVALLVIAADEGPMPQTREHLAILELLDVAAAVVALTKCDLVESEYAALVELEIADLLASTRFAGSPVVHTSSVTGDGLDSLRRALDSTLDSTPAKRDLGRPRLPIDRAFGVAGFGVVVTGTLLDGSLHVGEEFELQPSGLKARVRGLQRHKLALAELEPGTRAAVNLSGVALADVQRGMVLALPGALTPVGVVDVRLRATAMGRQPIRNGAGVTFLSATAESEARLRLLECEELRPGEEAWAQMVLETPLAVLSGDRCVLRASNETIAGGTIVATNAPRHRRGQVATIAALELLLAGSPQQRLDDLLGSGPKSPSAVEEALKLTAAEFGALLDEVVATGRAQLIAGEVYSTAWLSRAAARVLEVVELFLRQHKLKSAAPREHVRSAAMLPSPAFDAVVAFGLARSLFERRAGGLAPVGFEIVLSEADAATAAEFCARLLEGGASPPTSAPPAPELTAFLVEQGRVVDAGGGVFFAPAAYEEMVQKVRVHLKERGSITLAETRDLLGTSRKYAQALLELLDAAQVTRRSGDMRALR